MVAQAPDFTVPPLSAEEELLFEALARGDTSAAALASKLDLPIRDILKHLSSSALLAAIAALDAANAMLERHTVRLRHQAAFEALQTALASAVAAANPGEIRRIATQLLKPTPPLPDPEVEHAERAERITKSRRAVKDDAKTEAEDADYEALAAEMVPIPALDKLRAARRAAPMGATGDAGSAAAPVRANNAPAPLPSASSRRVDCDSSQKSSAQTQPLVTQPLVAPATAGHSAARPRAA